MKMAMLLITLILFGVAGYAQESKGGNIPDWYLEEMQRLVGTWTASNQDYMDGTTINDAFGIGHEKLQFFLHLAAGDGELQNVST